MNMQHAVHHIAMTLLNARAEKGHIRPQWEEWIEMAAKRRTVLALYCFDCVFATTYDLPVFPCEELRFVPAPASKVLWQAQTREEWESAYNRWLARWGAGPFLMGELMKHSTPDPASDAVSRQQMWLEEMDEFGMMMLFVVKGAKLCSCSSSNT